MQSSQRLAAMLRCSTGKHGSMAHVVRIQRHPTLIAMLRLTLQQLHQNVVVALAHGRSVNLGV